MSKHYFPKGALTTAPIHPNIRIGERSKALGKSQRFMAGQAIQHLQKALNTTSKNDAKYHSSEALRLARLLCRELGQ